MIITVRYQDGTEGKFGPFDTKPDARVVFEIIAARPDVKTAMLINSVPAAVAND
jgi:hypothetical protein